MKRTIATFAINALSLRPPRRLSRARSGNWQLVYPDLSRVEPRERSRGATGNQRKAPGFTLVELLTVIVIIGILATLVMVNLSSARQRARDTQRKADLATLRNALEQYINTNLKFPNSFNRLEGAIPDGNQGWWFYSTSSNPKGWFPDLVPTYLPSLPEDPVNKRFNGPGPYYPPYPGQIPFGSGSTYAYRSNGAYNSTKQNCSEGSSAEQGWFLLTARLENSADRDVISKNGQKDPCRDPWHDGQGDDYNDNDPQSYVIYRE